MLAEIKTIQRKAKIPFEPAGWDNSCQKLHKHTHVSGWEIYLLESYANFVNPFQSAMEKIYKRKKVFGLILRDTVKGETRDNKDRLKLTYVSHADTKWEKEHKIWAPHNGFCVPNNDCEMINGIPILFIPGTLVPYETVLNKEYAAKRFKKYNFNLNYIPYFYRPDNIYTPDNKREVFLAMRKYSIYGESRFIAVLAWPYSNDGERWIASFPSSYRKEEPIMRIAAFPQRS